MKQKGLVITTIIFFLIVHTGYFWEPKLGFFAMLAFFLLVIVFFVLAVVLLLQFIYAIEEKFTNKHRIRTLVLMVVVLCLTFLFPRGIIDFDKLSGNDLLVAQREGGGNCMTTLKLKDNNTFVERSVCFGVTEIKGDYKIVHDTIYFENVEPGRDEDSYYKFATIQPSKNSKDNKHFDLLRFKNFKDTTGIWLLIVKNDLGKPVDTK